MRLLLGVVLVCVMARAVLAQPGMTAPDPTPPAPPVSTLAPVFDHHGFTFEANLGIGFATASDGGASSASLGGLDLGLGGWVTPRVALTVRVAGVHLMSSGSSADSILYFVGPTLQYWVDHHLWAGGGIGAAFAQQLNDGCAITTNTTMCGASGWGLDARAGYAWPLDKVHAIGVSVELNPGFYTTAGVGVAVTGFALLFDYHYL